MSTRLPTQTRRLVSIGLGLTLGLALAGCSDPTPAPDTGAAASTPAPAKTPAATKPKLSPGLAPRELTAAEIAVASVPSELCYPGRLDGASLTPRPTRARTKRHAVIDGWVGDETTMSRPEGAQLRIRQVDGSRAWEMPIGKALSRTDVARKLGADSMRMSGFRIRADFRALPAGDYHLLVTHDRDGQLVACDQRRMIRLSAR